MLNYQVDENISHIIGKLIDRALYSSGVERKLARDKLLFMSGDKGAKILKDIDDMISVGKFKQM